MSEHLIELVRELADADAHLENCRYEDQDKARSRLNDAVAELRIYYETEIYDGPEE